MSNVIDDLKKFIKESETSFTSSKWLSDDKMQVYIRKGHHLIDGKMKTCLDIANVTVYKKSRGTFTAFLKEAHELNPWCATFAECIQEPRLINFFLLNGWTPVNNFESFYLIKNGT